jgi:hypothetical protein
MLDIFKGIVGTAAVLALALWWGARDRSSDVVAHALPVIAFLLPMLMRNGRWLIGCIGLFAAGIVFVVWDVGDNRNAPFVYLALLWIATGLVLGVTARYLLLALRAYLKRKSRWAGAGATHRPEATRPLPPITARSLMLSACAVIAALVAYSLFVMQSAKASAERIAAGRPYCMQVAKNNGSYRSARSRLDLAGFYMMSPSAKHSVLIVSDAGKLEFYHWSYRENAFVTDPYASPPIWCELAADFLKQPRAYREASVKTQNFLLHGYGFSIPNEYAPDVSSNTTIAIHADPPQFTPSGVGSKWTSSNYVSITIGYLGALKGWRQEPNDHYLVESLGEEHGLIKERVQSKPYRSSDSPTFQYYELEPDGDVKTLVVCMERVTSCTYMFTDGRFSYHFHHLASDLPRWRELQRTLASRVSGFVVDGGAHKP